MSDDTLATRTLERAAAAMRSSPIACLPEIVKLMRTLSGDSSLVSVSELADVIQQDPVVLAKVIGAANSFGYNPNAVPVTSVHQAIHVIGYERIRSLGMSLMLIEQTSRTHSAEEAREMAAQSLTAGCLALQLAERCPLVDAEQAFVGASLRNFGRLVMTSCMLDDYRSARRLAQDRPDDEAFREVFGLTPLELGRELLKSSNLPEEILMVLKDLPPAALEVLQRTPEQQMLGLTDLAGRLAELTLAPDLEPADYVARVNAVAADYTHLIPGAKEGLMDMIDGASRQLDHYVRTFKLKSLPTTSLVRLRNRRAAFRDAAQPKPEVRAPAPAAGPVATGAPAAAPVGGSGDEAGRVVAMPPNYDWQAQIDRVEALLNRPGVAPAHVLAAIVEIVARGMGTTECLLFSPLDSRKLYFLTHGIGSQFKQLRGAASVDPAARTVFGVCCGRKENIMIHHAADPKITPYLPDWLRQCPAIGACALLPLTDGQHVHGVVLAGWPEARQIVLSPEQVRHIRSLLSLACRKLIGAAA